MNLAAVITLNNSPFVKGLQGATGAVSTFVGKGLGMIANPVAAAVGGLLSFAAAAATVKSSISKAADMEDLQMSFVTLLGSVQAAKERMAELTKFAAETPFDLAGIGRASKVLQSLTDGALATGDGLEMVGDMAAMSGQPIAELSVQVGRLYSGLMSGKAAGEAIARLSELGLMSSVTRDKLEKLQAAGQKGAKVWQVAAEDFAKYSGEMERKSQGWNGLMSTLKDNISLAMAAFGEPVMDSLKPFLKDAIAMADSLSDIARSIGESVADGISMFAAAWSSGQVGELAGAALTYGFSIGVNWLLGALKSAVDFLGESIGAVFESLFQADFWSGLGNVIIASLDGVAAFVMSIFTTPIAYVRAGLMKVLAEVMESAASSAVGRKIFGVDEGFKALSFDDYLADSKAAIPNGAAELKNRASDRFSTGGMELSGSIGKRLSEAMESTLKNFQPGNLLDVSDSRLKLKNLTDSLSSFVEGQKAAAAKDGGAKTSAPAALSRDANAAKLAGDRLAKIGGFVGSGSNILIDYNRKIADNTAEMAKGITRLNDAFARGAAGKTASVWGA